MMQVLAYRLGYYYDTIRVNHDLAFPAFARLRILTRSSQSRFLADEAMQIVNIGLAGQGFHASANQTGEYQLRMEHVYGRRCLHQLADAVLNTLLPLPHLNPPIDFL